jgi:hypothetical protein
MLLLQDGRSRSFRSLQRLSAKMVAGGGGGGGAASALMCQEDQVLSALEVVRQVRCGWLFLGGHVCEAMRTVCAGHWWWRCIHETTFSQQQIEDHAVRSAWRGNTEDVTTPWQANAGQQREASAPKNARMQCRLRTT